MSRQTILRVYLVGVTIVHKRERERERERERAKMATNDCIYVD
mgnify:CR=1 FL=1